MKTFQDLYDEITKDDELKKAFVEALRKQPKRILSNSVLRNSSWLRAVPNPF